MKVNGRKWRAMETATLFSSFFLSLSHSFSFFLSFSSSLSLSSFHSEEEDGVKCIEGNIFMILLLLLLLWLMLFTLLSSFFFPSFFLSFSFIFIFSFIFFLALLRLPLTEMNDGRETSSKCRHKDVSEKAGMKRERESNRFRTL